MTIRIRIRPWTTWAITRLSTFDRARVWVWMSVPQAFRWSSDALRILGVLAFAMGLWRFGQDLGWTHAFYLQEGILSHWQVYLFAAVGFHLLAGWLGQRMPITTWETAEETEESEVTPEVVWQSRREYPSPDLSTPAVVLHRQRISDTISVR